jgi:hypothetical protein
VSRKLVVGFIVCLLTLTAHAQVPTSGNVFFGYSYMHANNFVPGNNTNLNGWNASLEGKVFPFIGIVADFSGHYGSQSGLSLAEHNFLFGPRVSFSVGKFRPFVHALFGASHISESATGISNSNTSFGDALGGGIDYRLWHIVAWRIQADALQTRFPGGTQNNFRLSTGLVVHF